MGYECRIMHVGRNILNYSYPVMSSKLTITTQEKGTIIAVSIGTSQCTVAGRQNCKQDV